MQQPKSELQNTISLAFIDDNPALIGHLVSELRMSTRRFTAYSNGPEDPDLLGIVVRENADDDPVSLRIRRLPGNDPAIEIYVFWAGARPSEVTINECRSDVGLALAAFPKL